jgi:hypothetical protein
MGLELNLIRQGIAGPPFDCTLTADENPEIRVEKLLWILGRREEGTCQACHAGKYHFQGTFTERALADENALDETYFVAPIPVNIALPHDPMEWSGLYWPRVEKPDNDPIDTGDLNKERERLIALAGHTHSTP